MEQDYRNQILQIQENQEKIETQVEQTNENMRETNKRIEVIKEVLRNLKDSEIKPFIERNQEKAYEDRSEFERDRIHIILELNKTADQIRELKEGVSNSLLAINELMACTGEQVGESMDIISERKSKIENLTKIQNALVHAVNDEVYRGKINPPEEPEEMERERGLEL